MTTGKTLPDINDLGGPAAMVQDMKANPDKYGRLKSLPERSQNNYTRVEGKGDTDINELYHKLGYSMPIAAMADMANKYLGFLRDGNVDDLDEKAAILDAFTIHRMIITSDCVLRKARYQAEEDEADRWLLQIQPDRQPTRFNYNPYSVLDGKGDELWEDYLESLLEDEQVLTEREEGEEEEPGKVAPNSGAQPPAKGPDKHQLPLLQDLLDRWGAADAFMLEVLLEEEQYGIEYAEQHYDLYERVERIRRDTEFLASLLPYAENAVFWCRVRQMGIVRERSYDVAMGFPIHDYSDVVGKIDKGESIHDLAQQLDWSFYNAYLRITGSMMDGHEHRITLAAMIAQQIPISSQMAQMMPPPGFWQGQGVPGAMPGQEGQGEEGQQDKRGAIFNFFKQNRNSGAQPAPDRKKTRRRNRNGS